MIKQVLIILSCILVSCKEKPIASHSSSADNSPDSTSDNQTTVVYTGPCSVLDSAIYHMNWVQLPDDCVIGNQPLDSIYVLNSNVIEIKKLVQQTGIKKIKNLTSIENGLYTVKYPPVYISAKLAANEDPDDCYYEENTEIFGYFFIGKISYLVTRGYGACMGHCTNLISINQQNELVDQIILTDDHSGKYGDGPGHSIKKINDTSYYQIFEITGCRGWDDQIPGDSLFRQFYQKSKITFSSNGRFKKEILETDSTPTFIKKVEICGPE